MKKEDPNGHGMITAKKEKKTFYWQNKKFLDGKKKTFENWSPKKCASCLSWLPYISQWMKEKTSLHTLHTIVRWWIFVWHMLWLALITRQWSPFSITNKYHQSSSILIWISTQRPSVSLSSVSNKDRNWTSLESISSPFTRPRVKFALFVSQTKEP